MRTAFRKCSILALVLSLCWVVYPSSQERIRIDINQVGDYLLPIALPELKGETADPALGQQIRAVMQRDLERTGLFRILESNGTGIQTIQTLPYGDWSRLGAAGVIAGQLEVSQGRAAVTLQLTLHDVAQQLMLFGKVYQGSRATHRRMAHRFSDHVLQVFTGEQGPFDTQVICRRPIPDSNATEIVRMDYDGHGVQRLVANGALNMAPVLSPDGTILAYTSYLTPPRRRTGRLPAEPAGRPGRTPNERAGPGIGGLLVTRRPLSGLEPDGQRQQRHFHLRHPASAFQETDQRPGH